MNDATGDDEPATTIIRGGAEWKPIQIPIRVEGAANYLGGIYDLGYSGAAAKAEMLKITLVLCAAIKATTASPETKLILATVSVIKKIGYKGALPSFLLKDYKDIDGILNDMYRTITKKMASFPYIIALHTTAPRRARHNTVL